MAYSNEDAAIDVVTAFETIFHSKYKHLYR